MDTYDALAIFPRDIVIITFNHSGLRNLRFHRTRGLCCLLGLLTARFDDVTRTNVRRVEPRRRHTTWLIKRSPFIERGARKGEEERDVLGTRNTVCSEGVARARGVCVGII